MSRDGTISLFILIARFSCQTPGHENAPHPDTFARASLRRFSRCRRTGNAARVVHRHAHPESRGAVSAGESARGILGGIRRRLVRAARVVDRPDLATVLAHPEGERLREAKSVAQAIGVLRHGHTSVPQISDEIGIWLPARAVTALRAHGISTLSDLTVRIPRRRQWWKAISGLGPASARRIEAFFAARHTPS